MLDQTPVPADVLGDPLSSFEAAESVDAAASADFLDSGEELEPIEENDAVSAGRHATEDSVETVAPENTEGDELGARPLGWLFRASQV